MPDRFSEIHDYYRKSGSKECSLWTNSDLIDRDTGECIRDAERDIGWLISEVERLRAENERLRTENELLKKIRSGQASLIQHIDTRER